MAVRVKCRGGWGSSPRIRGKFGGPSPAGWVVGIIPANTGKICVFLGGEVGDWDHPREYGENWAGRLVPLWGRGSSPRIRGKFGALLGVRALMGIIPANTGKMPPQWRCCRLTRDHPREYGENPLGAGRQVYSEGSSPRIRGKYTWEPP